jgi:hypothetical protein
MSLEKLQGASYELIAKCVLLWRTYQDTANMKGVKIDKAVKIHRMLIDAMRFHPDIKQLHVLSEMAGEVEKELAALRKVHPITPGSQGAKPTAAA